MNIRNSPGVLKMIQDCPICNKNSDDCNRTKGRNRNVTQNTSNINTDITQAAIVELNISQLVDKRITAQVQMPRIGNKRGVNAFSADNYVSVTR